MIILRAKDIRFIEKRIQKFALACPGKEEKRSFFSAKRPTLGDLFDYEELSRSLEIQSVRLDLVPRLQTEAPTSLFSA